MISRPGLVLPISAMFGALLAGPARASLPLVAVKAGVVENGRAVEVKLEPQAGIHLNPEGPWRLELSGPLAFAKTSFALKDFDVLHGRFRVPLESQRPSGVAASGRFRVTYFFCDDRKTWCRREVAEGEIH